MSESAPITTRTEEALVAYLAGMVLRGELVPGVRVEDLARTFATRGGGDLERAFVGLHEHLEGRGKALLDPEREVKPEATVRRVLRRMPLAENQADALYEANGWAAKYAGVDEGRAAARIWAEIHRPENHGRLANPPGPTLFQRRAAEAFEALRPYLKPGLDTAALARSGDWAAVLGNGSKRQAVATLATRLGIPHHAARLTPDGEPVRVDHLDIRDAGEWSDTPDRPLASRIGYGRM